MDNSSDVATKLLSESGIVPAFDDLVISTTDEAPLVEPGCYDAVVISCRKECRFNRDLIAFKFRLVTQGQFFDAVLPGYCNLDFGRGRNRQIPTRSKLGRWLRVINRFDPSVATRRAPLSIFSQFQFVVEVGVTVQNYLQRPLTEPDCYAKVQEILDVVGRIGRQNR